MNMYHNMNILYFKLLVLSLLYSYTNSAAEDVLIIAHRGYPCMYPEEILKGYEEAIKTDIDFIELDVVSTKDDHLVIRHDIMLNTTTNIADTVKSEDDLDDGENKSPNSDDEQNSEQNFTDYSVINHTLAEIRKLYAKQRYSFRDQSHNEEYRVAKLEEVLDLVQSQEKIIGLYIETKNPDFHLEYEKDIDEMLASALIDDGILENGTIPIYLQSFHYESLEKLNKLLQRYKHIKYTYLIEEWPSDFNKTIDNFSKFGHAIGIDKNMFYKLDNKTSECCDESIDDEDVICGENETLIYCSGKMDGIDSKIIERAKYIKDSKLDIHVYTFRNEGQFMALNFHADPLMEMLYFIESNHFQINGLFTDCAHTAMYLRDYAEKLEIVKYKYVQLDDSSNVWFVILIMVMVPIILILGYLSWKNHSNNKYQKVSKDIEMTN